MEILKILSKKSSSPTELASELNTTTAYISQQLKLLDAAELISKTKTRSSEKGKPRSLFRLSNDLIYLASLTKTNSEKRLLKSSDYHSTILKIWMISDRTLHYCFEKLYWKLEEDLNDIEAIFLDLSDSIMVVVSDSKILKKNIKSYLSKFPKEINCIFLSKKDLEDYSNKLTPLYGMLFSTDTLTMKEDLNEN